MLREGLFPPLIGKSQRGSVTRKGKKNLLSVERSSWLTVRIKGGFACQCGRKDEASGIRKRESHQKGHSGLKATSNRKKG